jgi:hypothetical protein
MTLAPDLSLFAALFAGVGQLCHASCARAVKAAALTTKREGGLL